MLNPAYWPRYLVNKMRRSFKLKLIALVSCMVILTFVITGFLVYRLNVRLMEEEITKQFSIANEQALARLELTFQEINRVSQIIVQNESVELFVRESEKPGSDAFTGYISRKYVEEQLDNLQVDAPFIRSVFLYNEKGELASLSKTGASGELGAKDFALVAAKLEAHRGNLVWGRAYLPSAIDEGGRRPVLLVARRMLNDTLNPYGTMVMVVEESLVSRVLRDLTENGNGKVLLLEPQGELLYANANAEELEQLEQLRAQADDRYPYYAKMDGIMHLFVRHRMDPVGFTLYGGVSLEEIQRKNKDIIQVLASAGVGVVLISALLITLSTRTLLAPLAQLLQGLRRLRSGDFSTRIKVRTGDELGYIGDSFNSMAEQVGILIDKVYLAELSERESELKAIQAQLNPHYLHNLFNELYWKLYADDQAESAQLVSAISEMLKYSLLPVKTDTTLQEELNQIRHYIKIQTELFVGEVETLIQVEERLLTYPMKRLLLLPLVENVFVHAFRNMEEERVLRIKVWEQDNSLHVEIADNGCGMDAETVRLLLNADDPGPGSGRTRIGVQSVVRRIELLCGPPYGLEMASTPGMGTTVKLLLPKREEWEA